MGWQIKLLIIETKNSKFIMRKSYSDMADHELHTVITKLEVFSVEKALLIKNWLIDNVGIQLPASGSYIHGYGWCIWRNSLTGSIIIELTDYVDDETITVFMLKWS